MAALHFASNNHRVYVQALSVDPSVAKVVSVAAGAGRHLRQGAMIFSIHRVLQLNEEDGQPVVLLHPKRPLAGLVVKS